LAWEFGLWPDPEVESTTASSAAESNTAADVAAVDVVVAVGVVVAVDVVEKQSAEEHTQVRPPLVESAPMEILLLSTKTLKIVARIRKQRPLLAQLLDTQGTPLLSQRSLR
jgi:hypothetical protein